jgi:hypothetical protein
VADRIGRILGSSATTQPAIDEQLQQIESQRPEKQDGTQGILSVPENMREIPVLSPLIKSGVFDMPTRPDDAERCLATDLARAFTDDSETPGGGFLLVWLGHLGADRADFSLVGIQRFDLVDIPKIHAFFLPLWFIKNFHTHARGWLLARSIEVRDDSLGASQLEKGGAQS